MTKFTLEVAPENKGALKGECNDGDQPKIIMMALQLIDMMVENTKDPLVQIQNLAVLERHAREFERKAQNDA